MSVVALPWPTPFSGTLQWLALGKSSGTQPARPWMLISSDSALATFSPHSHSGLAKCIPSRHTGPESWILPSLDYAQLGLTSLFLRSPLSARMGPHVRWAPLCGSQCYLVLHTYYLGFSAIFFPRLVASRAITSFFFFFFFFLLYL